MSLKYGLSTAHRAVSMGEEPAGGNMGNQGLGTGLADPKYDRLALGSRSFDVWEFNWIDCLRIGCTEALLGLLHRGLRSNWINTDPRFLVFYLSLAVDREYVSATVESSGDNPRDRTVFGVVDRDDVKRIIARQAWGELCRCLFAAVPACVDQSDESALNKRKLITGWLYDQQVLNALLEFFNPPDSNKCNLGYDFEQSPAWPFLKWFVLLPFKPQADTWHPLKYEHRWGCYNDQAAARVDKAAQMYFDKRVAFVEIMAKYGLLNLLEYKDLDDVVRDKLHQLAMTPTLYSVPPVDLEMAAAGCNDTAHLHQDDHDLALGNSAYPDAAQVLLNDQFRRRVLERRVVRDKIIQERREQARRDQDLQQVRVQLETVSSKLSALTQDPDK